MAEGLLIGFFLGFLVAGVLVLLVMKQHGYLPRIDGDRK